MSLPPFLAKQVGPLPLGGWLAVVGGGYAVSHYVRGRQSSKAAADAGVPGVAGSGVNMAPLPTSTNPSAGTGPTTNDEWLRQAEAELIARDYDPSTVDDALRRFISGQTEGTLDQQLIVNAALRYGGPLPQPLPPTGSLPFVLPRTPAVPSPPPAAPFTPPAPHPPPPLENPTLLHPGDTLPDPTGVGHPYVFPDGTGFVFG